MGYQSDLEIAQRCAMQPICDIARTVGIDDADIEPYGRHKAKVALSVLGQPPRGKGKLILVTAITPTPAGEGKTTTTIGLADALRRIGKDAAVALREPSLGPVFGRKGGATGGGYAQIVPMEDIDLHFTGDFHAIGAANNLLAAMLDNHIQQGNALGIDPRRITWRRCVDMNDRQLRCIVGGLGGRANGVPHEDGFDITAASEIMAVLCLAESMADLKARLGRVIVGYTYDGRPVTARDLKAVGAMAALLRDALKPNLVHAGVRAWRAVCQHRARVQQRARHAHGHAPLRLRRDGGRLRRRSRRGEVSGHQVPARRAAAGRCRRGGDGARTENARRSGAE